MKEISFRSLRMEDADMLLGWRNDPVTLANSINKKKVNREEHLKWLKGMLESVSNNLLLIAEWDGKPVGSFRLDTFRVKGGAVSPDMRLVSYVVAPEYRRKGLGMAIVNEGCTSYGQEYGLIAKIRTDNVASKKILEACDFECLGEVEPGIVAYARANTNGPPTLQ